MTARTASLFCFVLLLIRVAPVLGADRATLDAEFKQQLIVLAAKCDELGLKAEAAQTRAWQYERLPDRQYLSVPAAKRARPAEPASDDLRGKWQTKFLSLRNAQADKLFALSREQLEAGEATRSYRTLHDVLRENPDHADARAILGYKLVDGAWREAGPVPSVKKATVAHRLVKDFKPGNHWRVTSPHFVIHTSAGAAAGQNFAEQLELLHTVWRQVFFRYWSNADELRAQFEKPTIAAKVAKPLEVVLFKSREEYLANLAGSDQRLDLSQGFYADQKGIAFFYLGDARTEATCYHEVTHQLFQEAGPPPREVGGHGHFWLVEGIALYMESLRKFEIAGQVDRVTLGGWDADRMQYARHHVFAGQFQMPLDKLTTFNREQWQRDEQIKRLYSQSAGVAHYLMDAERGKYREKTITYLAGVYAGVDDAQALAKLTGVGHEVHDAAYKEFLRVIDQDLLRLDAPASIRNLCLGQQQVTEAGVAKLAACTQLQWLDLGHTPITDQAMTKLVGLKKLDQLNLENTNITDATLAWLGKQTQMRELDLSQTKITDGGIAQLGALTNLEVLWLTGTPVSDTSLPALQRFKKLKRLELGETKITPDGMQKLRAALPQWNSPQ